MKPWALSPEESVSINIAKSSNCLVSRSRVFMVAIFFTKVGLGVFIKMLQFFNPIKKLWTGNFTLRQWLFKKKVILVAFFSKR